jgi:hypothetical protein
VDFAGVYINLIQNNIAKFGNIGQFGLVCFGTLISSWGSEFGWSNSNLLGHKELIP